MLGQIQQTLDAAANILGIKPKKHEVQPLEKRQKTVMYFNIFLLVLILTFTPLCVAMLISWEDRPNWVRVFCSIGMGFTGLFIVIMLCMILSNFKKYLEFTIPSFKSLMNRFRVTPTYRHYRNQKQILIDCLARKIGSDRDAFLSVCKPVIADRLFFLRSVITAALLEMAAEVRVREIAYGTESTLSVDGLMPLRDEIESIFDAAVEFGILDDDTDDGVKRYYDKSVITDDHYRSIGVEPPYGDQQPKDRETLTPRLS